ncbi:MAG: hypothetical protein HGB21_03985 [Nitrospirae bacterium]|nr:hypothetical protein [Nitrospirota bacterium]NTW65464.1 hypothetical protein [Nitrospirota bacterium]
MKANASKRRVLPKDELTVLLRFVDDELEEWAKQDIREEGEFGDLRGSDQLPKQSKKTIRRAAQYYLKKVREKGLSFKEEVKTRLEDAKKEANDQKLKKVSFTDPASQFMKSKKGRIELSYNPQITLDKEGFILGNDATQSLADTAQLQPKLSRRKKTWEGCLKMLPGALMQATFKKVNINFLAAKKIDGYMPNNNERKNCIPLTRNVFATKN